MKVMGKRAVDKVVANDLLVNLTINICEANQNKPVTSNIHMNHWRKNSNIAKQIINDPQIRNFAFEIIGHDTSPSIFPAFNNEYLLLKNCIGTDNFYIVDDKEIGDNILFGARQISEQNRQKFDKEFDKTMKIIGNTYSSDNMPIMQLLPFYSKFGSLTNNQLLSEDLINYLKALDGFIGKLLQTPFKYVDKLPPIPLINIHVSEMKCKNENPQLYNIPGV